WAVLDLGPNSHTPRAAGHSDPEGARPGKPDQSGLGALRQRRSQPAGNAECPALRSELGVGTSHSRSGALVIRTRTHAQRGESKASQKAYPLRACPASEILQLWQ